MSITRQISSRLKKLIGIGKATKVNRFKGAVN